jgi:hypothetical protein
MLNNSHNGLFFSVLSGDPKALAIYSRLGYLRRGIFQGYYFQILGLEERRDDHRNFELEHERLKDKYVVGYRKIRNMHFFTFYDETFSFSVPKDMTPEEFQEFRKNAGIVYGIEWKSDSMT